MSGHTPGPWRIHWGRKRPHVKDARGAYVIEYVRTEADAHLISAAPDMLAALREVAHHADDECGFMVLVRAAIAKAEGR